MSIPIPGDYQPARDLLAGRTILVTGAAGGLGRAVALAGARAGATVVLLGRTVKKLEAVYDEIDKSGLTPPAIYPLNLAGATWKDYEDLAATLARELGRLDGLVHCAAHFKAFSPLDALDPADWIESLQVNLTAPYVLTRACLPLLRQAPDGSIVFVTDAAGRAPRPFHGAYGVAKAGLENLTAMWAAELASQPQLRVNTFQPGPMRTGVRLKGYPGEKVENQPGPETVAPKILWLLGPDSRGTSGQML